MRPRTTLAGSIKGVRNSILWTPAQLGTTVLNAWYDASDISTITLNSGNVSQWNDKSGNARHATQTNAAYQTPYSSAQINGLNVLLWPNSANPFSISTPSITTAKSFIFLCRYASGSQATWIVSNQAMFGGFISATVGLLGTAAGNSTWFSSLAYSLGRINGGSQNNLNAAVALPLATSIVEAVAPTTPGAQQFAIGQDRTFNSSNRGWSGPIGEVLSLSVELPSADREKVEGYLAWKWGITGSLPVGHPYKNNPPTV